MQITTVSDASAFPKDSGWAAGVRAKSGEFDLAIAALCALLSPTPVGVAQGQINTGNETTSSNETGNLKLADPTVLFESAKIAVTGKKQAGNGTEGLEVENTVQTPTGATNAVDLLNNQALQQNPAMMMAPVQNPQTAVLPFTGAGTSVQQTTNPGSEAVSTQSLVVADNAKGLAPVFEPSTQLTGAGSAVQQSTNPGSEAVSTQSPVVVDNAKGLAPIFDSSTHLTGAGSAVQQSTNPGSEAISTQSPVVADNAKGLAPVFSVAIQPEPGTTPQEALSVKTPVVVEPSQKGVQLPPEMVALSQGQFNQAIQETASKNKQKTTLIVAATDECEPAKEDEQSGIIKTGSLGNISPNEKPALKGTLQEAKLAIALSFSQTAQPDGKEVQPGPGKDGALVTLSESKTAGTGERTKQFTNLQSNPSQHNTAQLNPTQANPVQFDQIPTAQSTGDASKGVGLPDLKDKIVQEIKHLFATYKGGEPQTQVQLKLEPENLGQLTIKLYFNKGELSAHFYTGNNYVKDALEGSIQQLRDTLGQQDLRLSEALVFTGGDGSGGMGRFFDDRNGQAAPSYGAYNQRTYDDAQVEPAEFISTETDTSRVNYLI